MLLTDITEQKRAQSALVRLAQELEERVETRTSELADKNRHLQWEMAERSRGEQERQRLETRCAARERLESLAKLAAGIAHDFNNLLVGVLATPTCRWARARFRPRCANHCRSSSSRRWRPPT